MRRLMWFTIGFSVACGIGVYWVSGSWLLLLGVFCLVAAIAMQKQTGMFSRKAICVLVGCIVGFGWLWCFDHFYLAPVRRLDTQVKLLTIEVTDYPRSSQYGITGDGTIKINGKTYKVQFYINDDVSLSPGDRIEGGFRLRYTGGSSEKPTYHRGKGIFLLCYPKGQNQVISGSVIPMRYRAAVWRQEILAFLEQLFPGDTAPFAKALLLGETIGLDYNIRTSLKTSGVYHVVAVSGMHVSILFALVFLLCGKRRVLTALIGVPVLVIFAAIAGFSPSIVRACVMQILMILALLINREYDPPTALAAAVFAILACNPLTFTYVGFQLSVGCMVGIFLFAKRISDYFLNHTKLGPAKGKSVKARLTRWIVGSVSVTLGAMSMTAPLCAWYFGCISLAGIATNLLILWLISLIFYGIMAACVLGAIWLPLGTGIGWVLSYPIRGILWVTDMISRLPVSAVYTASIYIVAWLILCYVLITVFLKSKKKHPAVLTACIAVSLVCAIACSWIEPRLDHFRITAVDVGQGQCLILQNDGKYYMVDCGGDDGDTAADRATGLLLSQGIFRLDGLILTHYDADYVSKIAKALDQVGEWYVYTPYNVSFYTYFNFLTCAEICQMPPAESIPIIKENYLESLKQFNKVYYP